MARYDSETAECLTEESAASEGAPPSN
eukprot:COSAG02_NODE_47425_length_341_cov_0.764463_1_plen_26_part_10